MAQQKEETKSTQKKNLKSACDQIRALLADTERNGALHKFRIATMILETKDSARYGDDAATFLVENLGIDRASLYRHAKVAEVWDESTFKKLAARNNSNDLPLTWSHWELIATVVKGRSRHALIERALKDSLSVRELRSVIKGDDKATGDESPTVRPEFEDHNVVIARLDQFVGSVEAEAESWGNHLLSDIAVAKDDMTDVEIAHLRDTIERMNGAGEAIRRAAVQLKTLLEVVRPASPTTPSAVAAA